MFFQMLILTRFHPMSKSKKDESSMRKLAIQSKIAQSAAYNSNYHTIWTVYHSVFATCEVSKIYYLLGRKYCRLNCMGFLTRNVYKNGPTYNFGGISQFPSVKTMIYSGVNYYPDHTLKLQNVYNYNI